MSFLSKETMWNRNKTKNKFNDSTLSKINLPPDWNFQLNDCNKIVSWRGGSRQQIPAPWHMPTPTKFVGKKNSSADKRGPCPNTAAPRKYVFPFHQSSESRSIGGPLWFGAKELIYEPSARSFSVCNVARGKTIYDVVKCNHLFVFHEERFLVPAFMMKMRLCLIFMALPENNWIDGIERNKYIKDTAIRIMRRSRPRSLFSQTLRALTHSLLENERFMMVSKLSRSIHYEKSTSLHDDDSSRFKLHCNSDQQHFLVNCHHGNNNSHPGNMLHFQNNLCETMKTTTPQYLPLKIKSMMNIMLEWHILLCWFNVDIAARFVFFCVVPFLVCPFGDVRESNLAQREEAVLLRRRCAATSSSVLQLKSN